MTTDRKKAQAPELTDSELEQAQGGLLPAVHDVRATAKDPVLPTDQVTLNFTKVTYTTKGS